MNFSTRQAAKRLGLSHVTLASYIKTGKLSAPQMVSTGSTQTHIWTEAHIERVRKLLPKIKNGRKTRYQKLKNKPQAKRAVPHKKR